MKNKYIITIVFACLISTCQSTGQVTTGIIRGIISVDTRSINELNICLSESVIEILEVIKIGERANWNRAYKIFKQYFIGDPMEMNCYIRNPSVLFFQFEDNRLIATAKEPLIIVNQSLGYELKYFLDYFTFFYERGDISNLQGEQYYTYSGECLFSACTKTFN